MIRPVGCPVASVRHHERHQLGRISTRTGCVRNHRLEAVLRGVADIRREAVQARTLAMRVGAAADERLLDVGGPESFRLCVSAQDGVRAVCKQDTHNRRHSLGEEVVHLLKCRVFVNGRAYQQKSEGDLRPTLSWCCS